MLCPNCKGLGFSEFEAGLIRLQCQGCHGTGTVDGKTERVEVEDTGEVKIKRKRHNKRKFCAKVLSE
uniref:Uncharacterized protein n=1 Tax=viral metagenome TaxID=1070528 RepID=A0A6M3IWY7_9ZZZZ